MSATTRSAALAAFSGRQVDMRTLIISALAEVRAMAVEALNREIARADGHCEIDSKEAEVVISMLEVHLGRELAKVEDLEPDQLNTLDALTALIGGRNGMPDRRPR